MDAKLQDLTDKVLQGEEINRQEAEWLTQIDIEELAQGADRIRQERQQDEFDMCSVISIKGDVPRIVNFVRRRVALKRQ